jgi:O-antigen ligase
MPPQLAVLFYFAVVMWLFRRDFRERPNVTAALWLPFCWMMVGGTRFVSGWLEIFGLNVGAASVEEGSPVDALFFFVLIVAGLRVLYLRRVGLVEFMRQNRWVTIYLGYCLLSIAWSDFQFIAFKRWIKLFGQPVMVLVLLTEPDPMEAFARLMKRFAYLVVPISFLFIKYFPDLGRTFDAWSGLPTNTGITTNKNSLGCDCLILGLFFIWHFLRVRRREKSKARRNELILSGTFLGLTGWLLYQAHSATSLGALLLAVVVLTFVSFKNLDRRRMGVYLTGSLVVCALAELLFGVHDYVIAALGRDSTFTDRTIIWHILLNWDLNPVLGTGFETFWLGVRVDKFAELFHGIPINEAHNGYLETYIQLGLLGVFITLALLLATYFKALRTLLVDFDFGRFRLAYLAAFIVYNWTEAGFRTHSFPFFMFFLVAIDYPAGARTQMPVNTNREGQESDTGQGKCPQNDLSAPNLHR